MRDSFRESSRYPFILILSSNTSRSYSLYYSFQNNDSSSLPHSFVKSTPPRGTPSFAEKKRYYVLISFRCLRGNADYMPTMNFRLEELTEGMDQNNLQMIESAIRKHFHHLCYPYWNLPGLYETIHTLTGLVDQRLAGKGLPETDPLHVQRKSRLPYRSNDEPIHSFASKTMRGHK